MLPATQTGEPAAGQEPAPASVPPQTITNQQIADVLFNSATLLEMQQANPYRIAAYRNIARVLLAVPIPVAEILRQGGQLELPGLGRRLRRKIIEMATTGRMTFYDDLCQEVLAADVRELMQVPHVGPRTALRLTSQLGIHSIAELYEATCAHKLREHYGFGPRSEQRLEEGAQAILQRRQTTPAQTGSPEQPNPHAA